MNSLETIDEIRKCSKIVNDRADLATKHLAEIENSLVESGVGTEVWLADLGIGYAKIDGKWALSCDTDIALLKADRKTRMYAHVNVDTLIAEIYSRISKLEKETK